MLTTARYTIDSIKDEARQLVEKGALTRQQPIYTLCQYIPAKQWSLVECELEKYDFLLRDSLIDLLAHEEWSCD